MKKVIILSGHAQSGKDFVAHKFKEKLRKSITVSYAYYIKDYLRRMGKYEEQQKEKYRKELQNFGTDYLLPKMGDDYLINRVIDDIKVFSDFYDYVIITDARLINEIKIPKQIFKDVLTIHITRNEKSSLDLKEKSHITEIALDGYSEYDYEIVNDDTLDNQIEKIIKEV